VDTRHIAQKVAKQLLEHRSRLAGSAQDAQRVQKALTTAATAVADGRDSHRTSAATATSHWTGSNADGFDHRAGTLTTSLDRTATAANQAVSIVSTAASTVDGGHQAVSRLVDEYTTKAAQALDAGLAVHGAGSRAALIKAAGQVVDLVRTYTAESAKQLSAVNHQLTESVKQLGALQHTVDHDGVVDPKAKHTKPSGTHAAHHQPPHHKPAHHPAHPKPAHDKPAHHPAGAHHHPKPAHTVASKVISTAHSQLGYHEGPGNRNKYGPAAPWCSSFATWVWRKSGVNIPILPFSGDVYTWGQHHGLAYTGHHLNQARPGDVLLFGTGPQSPSTSTHIGIVESVHGNQVTMIEGNSGDQVQRVTHTLSSSTFYGGVHPR
jgi:hypothetical protein